MSAARWIVAVAALALVIGLLAWARGEEHHRGDEVGTIAQVLR